MRVGTSMRAAGELGREDDVGQPTRRGLAHEPPTAGLLGLARTLKRWRAATAESGSIEEANVGAVAWSISAGPESGCCA